MTASDPLPRPTARARSVAAVLLLVTVLALPGAPAARAGSDAASQLTAWLGDERAAAGRDGLTVATDLVEVATRHARRMAADGHLRHNTAVGDEVDGWSRLAENVGKGAGARAIHDAFMASSSHRTNILDGDMREVGIGAVRDDGGTLWVAQVFREPSAAAAAPAPAPSPSPTAPPAPATAALPPSSPTSTTPTDPVAPPAPRIAFRVDGVAAAPGPGVPIGPADHGAITTPPSPAVHHLRTTAGWLAVAAAILDG